MNISQNGLNLIKYFEGFRATAYYDVAGVLTIGYGHTNQAVTAAHYPVHEGDTITQDQAETILLADVSNYVAAVNNAVTVQINQNQFDALVSFTYNIVIEAFQSSDLLSDVNASDFNAAAQQFLLYVHSAGKVSNGLISRRTIERNLFLSSQNDFNQHATPQNTLIRYSGIFIPNQILPVSADTDPSSPAIATYDVGEKIAYDSYILVNGYAWISYISESGQRHYVAVGPDDGATSTTWGTGFFN
ncbi:glycoside hydrolase family protein [Fructobacillus tropaeoli]|uniref:Lysozyme n=1 Tax=Fructobacillus tropaeoli TaxID=709323 RepID=A0ABM9N216_9LACO|nr:GH24 family (RrrD) [Fructobacillus tropaeoli]